MCEPISTSAMIGMGISAASTIAGTVAQKKAVAAQIKARNAAVQADAIKQAGYQKQADVVNKDTTANFNADNQEALKQANIDKSMANNENIGKVGDFSANTNVAPVQVQSDIARQIANAVTKGKNYAKSSSNLNAYGQTQFDNGLALTKGANGIDQINNFSRGDSAVLPLQLQAASQKGQGSLLAADLFKGIGSIAGAYGMSQLQMPAGGTSDLYSLKGAASPTGINLSNPNIGTGIKFNSIPTGGAGVRLSI